MRLWPYFSISDGVNFNGLNNPAEIAKSEKSELNPKITSLYLSKKDNFFSLALDELNATLSSQRESKL
ncbi:hypothetical protein FQZ81_25445 [Escherichia coli]|nr:hypothetical protein [Escherichia coli]